MDGSDERREIERLADEVKELSERKDEPNVPRLRRFSVESVSSVIERDEFGRISRIVGPADVKTVFRNDKGLIVRVDSEIERVEDVESDDE